MRHRFSFSRETCWGQYNKNQLQTDRPFFRFFDQIIGYKSKFANFRANSFQAFFCKLWNLLYRKTCLNSSSNVSRSYRFGISTPTRATKLSRRALVATFTIQEPRNEILIRSIWQLIFLAGCVLLWKKVCLNVCLKTMFQLEWIKLINKAGSSNHYALLNITYWLVKCKWCQEL